MSHYVVISEPITVAYVAQTQCKGRDMQKIVVSLANNLDITTTKDPFYLGLKRVFLPRFHRRANKG